MEGSSSSSDSMSCIPRSCPVCLGPFDNCQLGKPDYCNHLFCLGCIYEWSKNVNTCPVDRTPFSHIEVLKPNGEVSDKIFVPDRQFNDVLEDPEGLTYCEGAGQRSKNVIYIIDVLAVYGKSFASKPLKERLDVAEVLCKTLNKPSKSGFLQIKVKPYLRLKEIEKEFDKLTIRKCKGVGDIATFEISEDTFIAPSAVIFCKVLKHPWQLHVSKIGKFYFFNTRTNERSFDPPQDSIANYMTVVKSRHIWKWEREIYKDLCGIETNLETSELSWSIFKRKLKPALSNS